MSGSYTKMRWLPRGSWTAAVLAGLGAGMTGPAIGAEPAAAPPAARPVPAPILVVDAQGLVREREANKVVDTTRDALARSGTAPLYAPAAIQEIALREATMTALQKSLDIRRSGLNKSIAERALVEAEAVFDPVFVAALTTSIVRQFPRTEHPDNRFRPGTERVAVNRTDSHGVFTCTPSAAALTVGADAGQACYVVATSSAASYLNNNGTTAADFAPRSPVLAIQYNQERPEGYYPSQEDANPISKFAERNTETYTGSLSILQQLPWGSSLNLTLSTTRRQTYYPLNVYNGLGETFGVYYRPWFSQIIFGGTAPLPYTKNFGPTAIADTNVAIARTNIEAAEVDVRTVVNTTLLQVDTLYWSMVGTIQRLAVIADSLKSARQQRASIQRLFDQGFVTESDRQQAESQVANVQATQQQVFGEYVVLSERLRRLLDSNAEALYLPVGYRVLLEGIAKDVAEPKLTLNNPFYVRQAVAVRLASIVRDQRDAQTRPDLAAVGNMQFSQTGSYGYRNLGSSLREIGQPDQYVLTIGLLYQRPIGNRAAKAALAQSEHALNRQNLLLQQVELGVREEFEDARAALSSARKLVKINGRAAKLSQESYGGSLTLQDQGLVPSYESLNRLLTLLNARLAEIQARIDERVAESRLLASIGALAESYGERTAQTPEDRFRLARLRESGALQHFGGPL